ncbi:hypothetical protein AVM02_03080 [Brucella anthropi]
MRMLSCALQFIALKYPLGRHERTGTALCVMGFIHFQMKPMCIPVNREHLPSFTSRPNADVALLV